MISCFWPNAYAWIRQFCTLGILCIWLHINSSIWLFVLSTSLLNLIITMFCTTVYTWHCVSRHPMSFIAFIYYILLFILIIFFILKSFSLHSATLYPAATSIRVYNVLLAIVCFKEDWSTSSLPKDRKASFRRRKFIEASQHHVFLQDSGPYNERVQIWLAEKPFI